MYSLTLELSEEEAQTLMAMMQNTLHADPIDETPIEAEVRYAIFDALHTQFHGNQRQSNFVPEGSFGGLGREQGVRWAFEREERVR
jgi:hypothetical protein